MPKHTAGPWFVSPTNIKRVVNNLHQEIGQASTSQFTTSCYPSQGEAVANAALFAAAPELLEALKLMIGSCYDSGLISQVQTVIDKAENN